MLNVIFVLESYTDNSNRFSKFISEGNEYWRTGMATVHGYGYGIRDMGSKCDCI